MAVCGRCLICGHKFHGDGSDETVRWQCVRGDRCADASERLRVTFGEMHEHAICVGCHDGLVDDTAISTAADALLALVRARSEI